MSIVQFNNLTKMYGKSRGIIEVSFKIEKGEIFGFIGPNGSGKSTAIRTLLSLIKPTNGEASIFGTSCTKLTEKELNEVGYLPSEVNYYDGMKVKDLLDYSASFYKKDCSEKQNKLVKLLDLDLNKKISDLSLGNRKKVGIVQCLQHSPKLIILDEPTSGLDPLMQQTFFNILLEEREKGNTIFFSSHVLSEVQKLCNRVAIIKEGRLVKVENISDLKMGSIKKVDVILKEECFKNNLLDENISSLKIQGNKISFMYTGESNNLIRVLSTLDIDNIHINEPDLEEVFMHYYEDVK